MRLIYQKNSDKEKWVYHGYGRAGSWNLRKDFAENVVISGVNNSWSSHTDNCQNKFLGLDEDQTYGTNLWIQL